MYYEFFQTKDFFRGKITLLNKLKGYYKDQNQSSYSEGPGVAKNAGVESHFYNEINKEIEVLRKNRIEYVQNLLDTHPGMYAARLIKVLQAPLPDKKLAGAELREYLKDHFLDNVDFSDTALLNSNVIPAKIWKYFELYKDKKLNITEQEVALIKASDIVLSKAGIDKDAFGYVLDMLVRRFEKSGFEILFTYLTENYALANSCKDNEAVSLTDREKELKEKIEIIKKLAVDKPAPEIEIHGVDNEYRKLSDIDAEGTLVLFWASWCTYCKSLMPQLKDLYNKYRDKGFEVLAISIDEDRGLWEDSLEKGQYSWINYSELKGWDSKACKDYNVRITPKMYLLDKEKKIKAKPRSIEELEGFILTIL